MAYFDKAPLLNPEPSRHQRPDDIYLRDVNMRKYLILNATQTLALDILFYPVDVVKTRLQVQNLKKERMGDMFRMFKSLISTEGSRGLYRGMIPSLTGNYPSNALYYVSFEWARNICDDFAYKEMCLKKHLYCDVTISGIAGLIAEAASALLWVPTDIIAQRLRIKTMPGFGNPHHQGALDVVKSISKLEGLQGFFRGYWAALMIYGPASAIWWGTYEFFKDRIHVCFDAVGITARVTRDVGIHAISGCFAGITSSSILNPLEVALTRYQTMEASSASNVERLRRGFLRLFFEIIQKEGLNGLYRGFLPRLIVSIPGTSLSVAAYEFIKRASKNDSQYFSYLN